MILNYTDVDIYQDDQLVLEKVNFSVEEGEMVYLTGPVGSGKSSLLKTIYGELPVEGGKAEVLGFNMGRFKTKHQPALRKQMGIVFQDFQLLRDRTVHRNLDFVLRSTGWKKKAERESRIVEVLEMVKLADKKDKFIYELSGGEQQRICIARAILNNPKVILVSMQRMANSSWHFSTRYVVRIIPLSSSQPTICSGPSTSPVPSIVVRTKNL